MSSVPKPERTTRRRVGLAVAVGVLEVDQFGAVGDVGAAVARLDAGGDQQAVGEDGGLVGLAVAVACLRVTTILSLATWPGLICG